MLLQRWDLPTSRREPVHAQELCELLQGKRGLGRLAAAGARETLRSSTASPGGVSADEAMMSEDEGTHHRLTACPLISLERRTAAGRCSTSSTAGHVRR